ncbi:LysR substrate-binding domain-containing protein [Sphingopyxis macrogoltabida]|uniref:LysR family transcriptional regulator n=1 Tax=Sphingopyxis macrogoltabida TaxID=33050 RepID=A0AAC9FG31_SPHMC|nr:LysR substrate-binding domain-containing protein [Sphingopyxis macrogoltabida]ALJ14709.1 LysR family transcriptional regulator [Sphingopyxis macrogoltabida]AMU90965.1 LysR family transcriptional regulator [Sphingopyxis macrogoltabida]
MNIWNLNLRHLKAAAETARLGTISEAARAVHLTQPAVTQALSRLERQVGLPLFERHPGGIRPTEAARLLVPRITAALDLVGSPRVTMAEMHAFIALADAGSYGGASLATGLSQPTLHRGVRDLSVALARSLTERRGRGIALTHQGRRLARNFRLARAELEAGIAEVDALKGQETGRIAIGAMPLSRARILPSAVALFLKQWPEAVVDIVEGSYAELIEPLRDGTLDILVGALRDPGAGDDLVRRRLFDDRPAVIGRHGHPLAGQSKVDMVALASLPWIVPPNGTPLRAQWNRMFDAAGIEKPRVPVECGSVMMIRQILMGSDMLTLLSPDQVAVELEAHWLAHICDAPPDVVRTIGVTHRSQWRPTARQRAFVDLMYHVINGE